ncbi:MAG TPA: 4-alpha-glucanotransferase [Steroidobacteraceae bacterium]|nr:4-alpha-glucanotransferase [Steroidobacteraceae bacterium]
MDPRQPVFDRRRAGVLLHPTSLIAGHGALGSAGRAFVDWLAAAGFSVWQMLPLGPVGPDGSPYWARSDGAGNPALIDSGEAPDPNGQRAAFDEFCHGQSHWLEDDALFEVLSTAHGGKPWWEWPAGVRNRKPEALQQARERHAAALHAHRVQQWRFAWQWQALRRYARDRGVRLFGDLPIYVAPDSAVVWAERQQFQLAPGGRSEFVAGVPPDYFSADGQLWGNPLYDWQQAEKDGFRFWRARLAQQLQRFDVVRIDHFRGLEAYWAVPAGASTARGGEWRKAPGVALFTALRRELGDLPIVAEDLGVITPEVEALRKQFAMPGMRVLQFGFDGNPGNTHLPHNFSSDAVAYSGTHDNDTTLGWYRALDPGTAGRVDAYLRAQPQDFPQALVHATLASVAQLAILPLQDLLALGSEARFNIPGTVSGNWRWKLPAGALSPELAGHYAGLNQLLGRR